ncbi:hypothetical protein JCM10296v2_003194 [Rhodotorula toruloides]
MLDKLPNELLLLNIQLALPTRDALSPKVMRPRQALLMSLSQVNKRLCDLVRPLLYQSILITTFRQAKLVAQLPKKLRKQVETVVFRTITSPTGGINPFAARDMPALNALAVLTNVKHVRFYGFDDFVSERIFGNQSLRLALFQDHRERGWDGTLGADLRRLPKLVSHPNVVQVDASCEFDYLPLKTADRRRFLYHLGYSSARTRTGGGAEPSMQFIRLDAASLVDTPYLPDRLPQLHDLRAVFVDRAIHPDTIKPEMRDLALALLNAVNQTPAEIIWTGSDKHDLILPEFERYIRERQ